MTHLETMRVDREIWDNFAKEHNCQVDVLAKEIDDLINEQLGFEADTQIIYIVSWILPIITL